LSYDSRPATYEHIRDVQVRLMKIIAKLQSRLLDHDRSKLVPPEVEAFDRLTPLLKATTYGSPEYERLRGELGEALTHHYAKNSHHPEHHERGIHGMTLVDAIEMLADWASAAERHADGDILKSIEINQKRFGYGDEIKNLLLNTLAEFE
jgi:hypothetical protein